MVSRSTPPPKKAPTLGTLKRNFSETFSNFDAIPGSSKADRINLCSLSTVPMRAFHMTWVSFFLCFFGWFGLSPMTVSIKKDLGLSTSQMISTTQASIGSTIVFRVILGLVCDKIGPRISYTVLMICGAFPVAFVGLAQSYESFLVGRLLIGTLGAGFVLTQYHASAMFSAQCVGTANALTAGWGNLGGGVTNLVMPFVAIAVLKIWPDLPPHEAWRYAVILPAFVLVLQGVLYFLFTKDSPDGNKSGSGAYANKFSLISLNSITAQSTDNLGLERELEEVTKRAQHVGEEADTDGLLCKVLTDYRLYLLMFAYGSCFGIELIMLGNSSIYLQEKYDITAEFAGLIIFIFSSMNLFARGIGGAAGDKFGNRYGVHGRVYWLSIVLCCEGLTLILWSRLDDLTGVIAVTFVFGLFVMMCEGATFSVVPFIEPKSMGVVSGLVGAGGNLGAVIGLTLFKADIDWSDCFMYLGCWVIFVSLLVLTTLFKFKSGVGKGTGKRKSRFFKKGNAPSACAVVPVITETDGEPETNGELETNGESQINGEPQVNGEEITVGGYGNEGVKTPEAHGYEASGVLDEVDEDISSGDSSNDDNGEHGIEILSLKN